MLFPTAILFQHHLQHFLRRCMYRELRKWRNDATFHDQVLNEMRIFELHIDFWTSNNKINKTIICTFLLGRGCAQFVLNEHNVCGGKIKHGIFATVYYVNNSSIIGPILPRTISVIIAVNFFPNTITRPPRNNLKRRICHDSEVWNFMSFGDRKIRCRAVERYI